MDQRPPLEPEQKVWYCNPNRNNNSLAMTIPAAIRQKLNWHMNAPLIVTLVDDHMEVRQINLLAAAGAPLPGGKYARRKKSWKRPPVEEGRTFQGYKIEPDHHDKEEN